MVQLFRGILKTSFAVVALLLCAAEAHAAVVKLAWDLPSPTGITGYKIYYSSTSGACATRPNANCFAGPVINSNTTSTTNVSLNPGTYYFVVTSYNASTESANSGQVSSTVFDLPVDLDKAPASQAANLTKYNNRTFSVVLKSPGTATVLQTTVANANASAIVSGYTLAGGSYPALNHITTATVDLTLDTAGYLVKTYAGRTLGSVTRLAPLLAGDVNNDTGINELDVSGVLGFWADTGASQQADFNIDGAANELDVSAVLSNFN